MKVSLTYRGKDYLFNEITDITVKDNRLSVTGATVRLVCNWDEVEFLLEEKDSDYTLMFLDKAQGLCIVTKLLIYLSSVKEYQQTNSKVIVSPDFLTNAPPVQDLPVITMVDYEGQRVTMRGTDRQKANLLGLLKDQTRCILI
jgi:hypothetical protein